MDSLTAAVVALAKECGFDLVGITPAEPFTTRGQQALERVERGLMDGLPWYTEARVQRGADPHNLLPSARSIVSLALSYYTPHPNPLPLGEGKEKEGDYYLRGARLSGSPPSGSKETSLCHSERSEESGGRQENAAHELMAPSPLRGRVARYAWGEDYHRVFERKVKEFVARLPEAAGRPVATRWYTDTGPMQDRAVAERAGIGWYGKNTNILTSIGSWVLLAQVLTDLDLEPGTPLKKTCGACTLCIDACPTGALIAPGVLDNRTCISFQTIENRGPIPRELRPLMGDWVFGCDVCQDVCPVNRKAQLGREYAVFSRDADDRARPELIGLLNLDEATFKERFRGSPVLRAKLTGLKRNACVALGNIGDPRAVPVLARALREEPPLVRGHAAWSLGRIGGQEAREALPRALDLEEDPWVREEIEAALLSIVDSSSRCN